MVSAWNGMAGIFMMVFGDICSNSGAANVDVDCDCDFREEEEAVQGDKEQDGCDGFKEPLRMVRLRAR